MHSHSEFSGLMRNTTTFFSMLPADLAAGLLKPYYYFYNTDPNVSP